MPKIYFHDVQSCSSLLTSEAISGIHKYGSRVLASSCPEDIVIVSEDCKPHKDYIIDHYRQVGLEVGELICGGDYNTFSEFLGYTPDVFYYGGDAHRIIGDAKRKIIVSLMNNKNFTSTLFDKLLIPTPQTFCFNSKEHFKKKDWIYPVFFKPAIGASGIDIKLCNNFKEILACVEQSTYPFQIQCNIDAICFLNLQYCVTDNWLHVVNCTEQILNNTSHIGNVFPVQHVVSSMLGAQIIKDGNKIALWMLNKGMKGYFAFDILVSQELGRFKYYFLECNPRYNGSTYPSLIAEKLSIKQWTHKIVSTTISGYNKINLNNLVYNSRKDEGIIIVNWGTIDSNSISVMFIGETIKKQQKIEDQFCCVVQ